ncbi:MAG: redoxin domain-containing protein [Planctomycetia bacterium]|nr:redoxin domain-containing protein [Planctomycetia bacterium]
MSIARRVVFWALAILGFVVAWPGAAQAQVTVKAALSLRPQQPDVDYDTPDAKTLDQCKVALVKEGKATGWIVTGPGGQALRKFMDIDGVKDDKGETTVDEFSYYKNGLEVYREIDSNGNGKKDQYRWFNFAGTRWGIATKEDGKIDIWKQISAEEVSRIAVKALATQDASLLAPLLITKDDLKQLGIRGSLEEKVLTSVADPAAKLRKAAASSKTINAKTTWLRFDATPPGVVPAESIKAAHDVVVYENVMGIVDSGNPMQPGLVMVGELVKLGDAWKMTSLPVPIEGNSIQIEPGLVMNEPLFNSGKDAGAPSTTLPKEVEELVKKLQDLMEKRPAPDAAPGVFQKWEKSVETVLIDLINAVKSEDDKLQWTRQLLDNMSMAVQSGKDSAALGRLKKLETEIGRSFPKASIVVTAKYRVMYAEYLAAMQEAEKDNDKKQETHDRWLSDLSEFLEANPKFDEALDATVQLAQEYEFAGKIEKATKWYQRVVKDFPGTPQAARAAGALKRLELVGKTLALSGPGFTGGTIDVKQYRGKVVCVAFWDTFNRQYIDELPALKALYDQHHAQGFEIIGINLDIEKGTVGPFLQKNGGKWPQIYAPGGQDSPLAVEFGIYVLPTMFVVDREGKVVNRSATVADLKSTLPEALGKK